MKMETTKEGGVAPIYVFENDSEVFSFGRSRQQDSMTLSDTVARVALAHHAIALAAGRWLDSRTGEIG